MLHNLWLSTKCLLFRNFIFLFSDNTFLNRALEFKYQIYRLNFKTIWGNPLKKYLYKIFLAEFCFSLVYFMMFKKNSNPSKKASVSRKYSGHAEYEERLLQFGRDFWREQELCEFVCVYNLSVPGTSRTKVTPLQFLRWLSF